MGLAVRDILKIAENRLMQAGIEDCKNDAELLYCHMMNIDRARFFMSWSSSLSDELCEHYFQLLDRRCARIPLQHITGHQEFMGFDFEVNDKVLIPRQDTEILVETARSLINSKDNKIKKVLDLCTGSGAIAVSLSGLEKGLEVTASDISEEALAIARKNGAKNGTKVNFVSGDLFEPFKKKLGNVKFDMILSNPPYIRSDEIPTLQTEVRDYEPVSALDGGMDGLDFYRRIIDEAPEFLKKKGILVLEIGWDQAQAVTALAEAQLDSKGQKIYESCAVIKDLAGLDRVAVLHMTK